MKYPFSGFHGLTAKFLISIKAFCSSLFIFLFQSIFSRSLFPGRTSAVPPQKKTDTAGHDRPCLVSVFPFRPTLANFFKNYGSAAHDSAAIPSLSRFLCDFPRHIDAAGGGVGEGVGHAAAVADNVKSRIFCLEVFAQLHLHVVELDLHPVE